MSAHDFHLHFSYKGKVYDFDLEEQPPTSDSVNLNGHTYSLSGSDARALKAMVPELNSPEGISSLHLTERLWSLNARDIRLVDRINAAALARFPSRPEKGNVIILIGHSSAGKSTIIEAIKRLEPERAELGGDRTPAERIYRYVAKHYTEHGISQEDWDFLHRSLKVERGDWQIHKAMFGEFMFKPNLSDVDQLRVKKIATALREVLDRYFETHRDNPIGYTVHKSFQLAQSGTDVVFDVVKPEDIPPDSLSDDLAIKRVLVYCPFHALSERVAERNRKAFDSGRSQEARLGAFPLMQFAELFGPRMPADKDADVIDRITKEMVERDFDIHFDAGIEATRQQNPRLLEGMDIEAKRSKEKEALLIALGFRASDLPDKEIELTPRHHYDVRINTADPSLGGTPEEKGRIAAARILGA